MMLSVNIGLPTPFEELVLRSMYDAGDAADAHMIWREVLKRAGRANVSFTRVHVALFLLERSGGLRSEVCTDKSQAVSLRVRRYWVTSQGYLAMDYCRVVRRRKGREHYEQASRFGLCWDLVLWANRRIRAIFLALSMAWDDYLYWRAEKARQKRRQPPRKRTKIYSQIILADWKNHRGVVYTNAAATLLVTLAVTWFNPQGIDAKLALVLSGAFSAVLISQFCARFDRKSASIKSLLGSETQDQFIFAKFLSALSMTAVAVNVPGLMLLNFRFLLNLNAGVLLFESLCLSFTMTDWEGAGGGGGGFFEIFALAIVILVSATYWWVPTVYDYGKQCVVWLLSHPNLLSIAALCAIPVIIVWSIVLGIETE